MPLLQRRHCTPHNLPLLADNFLLRRHRAAPRTFAGTRVGVRPLTAHRQVAPMTDSAIRLDFDQPADIHLDLFAEIAFHTTFLFNFLAQTIGLVFREIANLFCIIDARFFGELPRARLPDAVDRGQTNPQAFLRRKIDTCYACHKFSSPLALFVFWVLTDHPHNTTPMDHLALVTNLFYRCSYFHELDSLLSQPPNGGAICSDKQCGRALNRTAKALQLPCLPPGCG